MSGFDVSLSTVICFALSAVGASLAYFGETRVAMASGVIVAYLALCAGVLRAQRRRSRRITSISTLSESDDTAVLIAYASQTGFAEQLAVQTAHLLDRAGQVTHLEPLDALGFDTLVRYRRMLFIVSTTGEGDAPDNAASFVRKVMSVCGASPQLHALRYGVLALGDRNYQEFCAFGNMLNRWLCKHQAETLFPLIEMNNGDPAAWRSWQACLSTLAVNAGENALPSMSRARWTLSERTLLNPGSEADPAFHVCLEAADPTALNWQAGDIAEIWPQQSQHVVLEWMQMLSLDDDALVECDGELRKLSGALASRTLPATVDSLHGQSLQAILDSLDPLPSRLYSISSLPADGRLELLVRQLRYPAVSGNGVGLGLASGWLTQHAAPGAPINVRVRTNRGFHAPKDDGPLILIGAGTGLAGLRAHLKYRAARGQRRNWLIFGERSAAHDAFHEEEIAQWQADGVLQHLDKVWSRDDGECRYVHDAMREAAQRLRQWVEDGASIYVCGSAQRMARTVHAALVDILGDAQVDGLREAGRYRRDVY